MENDSAIIDWSIWSINNDSPLRIREKYHKEEAKKSPNSKKSSQQPVTVQRSSETSSTGKHGFCHELRSLCCFISFFTLKSFKFHSLPVYMILLGSLALFMQMVQGGYLPAIMTSIQTQFNISTSKIGFIVSSFDIMGVFATPIVSYIGTRYNKCKIMGICGIFYVFGACIYTFPYFFGGTYTVKVTVTDLANSLSSNVTDLSAYQNSTVRNVTFQSTVDMCKVNTTTGSTLLATTTASISTAGGQLYSSTTAPAVEKGDGINCNRNIATSWTYFMFIIAQMFMSVGSAPLFALGVTYLCSNSEEEKHATFTGVIYGCFALGPALGYVTASVLLAKWVYINQAAPVDEKDPRWVGCWYPGLLIAAGAVFIMSILLMSFPETLVAERRRMLLQKRRMKKETSRSSLVSSQSSGQSSLASNDRSQRRLDPIEEAYEVVENNFQFLDDSNSNTTNTQPAEKTTNSRPKTTRKLNAIFDEKRTTIRNRLIERIQRSRLKFKGFLASFLKLILNLRYTLLVLILSIECILIAAFTNYMILYSQHVYQIPSSQSSILVGGVVVPSAIVGAVLGGLLVRKFDLQIEGCVRLIILSSAIVIAGLFVLLFVKCDGPPSQGIDLNTQTFNLTFDKCNSDCNCRSAYNPTCGSDTITYVSPCYAGCKTVDAAGYYDCSCINSKAGQNSTVEATPNACSRKCGTSLIVFLILLFVVIAAESLCLTPATMLILKLIEKKLHPFALGVLRCANILIAYIPAPIVLSNIIDRTCLLWNNQCIGDKGTCLEYDSVNFHLYLFATSVGIKIFSCILLVILSIYIHKSFILRHKYRSRATLNHDITSVLTPKQKYRIDSIVASTSSGSPSLASSATTTSADNSSSEDTSSLRERYFYKPISKLKGEQQQQTAATPAMVVLKKHTVFDDDFTSVSRAETPAEFFLFNDLTTSEEDKTQANSDSNNKTTNF